MFKNTNNTHKIIIINTIKWLQNTNKYTKYKNTKNTKIQIIQSITYIFFN